MVEMTKTADFTTNVSTGKNTFALTSLTSLFFMWGFITALNDILIPHLKGMFDLTYLQAMAVNFCFFGAYAIVSYPAGNLVRRIGYQKGLVLGLATAGVGCMLFYPAAGLHQYWLFLAALFVLAGGITILQVSANPYVSVLGDPKTASSRLTLTQAFNAAGTTVAPYFGAVLILSVTTIGAEQLATLSAEQLLAYNISKAQAVQLPYVALGLAFWALALIFNSLKLPVLKDQIEEEVTEKSDSALNHKHLVLGAIGIFMYVGGEVSIGSFLVNFLAESNIAGMAEHEAAKYVAFYWGGAMVGRFVGAAIMMKISGGKVLAFNSLMVVLLLLVAVFTTGSTAMWAILAIGLFNSIMFPAIFSLAITGLGKSTSQGSGILCFAIVGGAILPLVQGALADSIGIQLAFLFPIICYAYIAHYGLKGSVIK